MASAGRRGRGAAPLRRLRRRGGAWALFLLPFLLAFSSTRIYCENCRYTSIPGFTAVGAPPPPSITGGGCCRGRAPAGAAGEEGSPSPRGSVQHKRSPVCIAKHLPLQEGAGAPSVTAALERFAGSDVLPLPALHEADAAFPRSSRAPPA